MQKPALFIVLLGFLALAALPAYAQRVSELVADAETGRILYGENIHEQRYPASLTKIMTLYLTFSALDQGRIKLTDQIPISFKASIQPPSKLGLPEGDSISVKNAILALVTESANDIAVAVGEFIGGSEERFGVMMTQQALSGVKRLFDLAAEPQQISLHLGELAAARPGLRVPGAFDGYEMAVRAILGQQISVKAASTLSGRFAAAFGSRLPRRLTR